MEREISEVLSEGMGDGRLESLAWAGNDLIVGIALPLGGGKSIKAIVRFFWVTKLKVDLDFDDYMGTGLLWGIEGEMLDNTRWIMKFDFAGTPKGGGIEFECNAVCDYVK